MRIFTVFILLVCICITACKQEAVNSEYDNSFKAWQSFKQTHNNSYFYVTEFNSWTGFKSKTKITVSNGAIISRDFESYHIEGTADTVVVQPIAKWREVADSIGKHELGLEPLTLDGIYLKAKNEWLKANKKENTIYFENKNNGMISLCGYWPKNCMDDCLRGIHIVEIAPLPAD